MAIGKKRLMFEGFQEELYDLFQKYINAGFDLEALIRSADLYVDTVKKEIQGGHIQPNGKGF